MLIFQSVIFAVIAAYSPFFGLIFTLAISGKNLAYNNRWQLLYSGGFVGTLAVLAGLRAIPVLSMMDAIVGVLLTAYIIFRLVKSNAGYVAGLIAVTVINLVYAVIRHFAFKKYMQLDLTEVLDVMKSQESGFIGDAGIVGQNAIKNIVDFLLDYNAGLWVISAMIAAYIGVIILNKSVNLNFDNKIFRLPFATVYVLIGFLAIFIIPGWRKPGLNLIMMIAPLFLIQGIAVMNYYWGKFFKQFGCLMLTLVGAIMLNVYIQLLIVLVGVFDLWFNFRKIPNWEEINENNT